ncbi:MAG: hypothetical protein ACUVTY_05280 [Armatimonadota bacterium]
MRYLVAVALAIVGVGALGGCGGVVLGTSKTISNPFGLLGRSADMDTSISGDGLTMHLTATGTLQFTLNDQTSSGNPLAPFEGMSRMEISQKAKLVFSINSAGTLPSTFTLRNVNLRVTVHASDGGGTHTSAPIEFTYTGFLTLDRQPGGRYTVRENLSFQNSLDRFDGSSLIAILVSGGVNTITANISFAADTSSPNVPSGTMTTTSLQFGEGSATVRW